MEPSELTPAERIAEGLWQTVHGIDGQGEAAHQAWLALPETEKNEWRAHAEQTIANWRQANGFA